MAAAVNCLVTDARRKFVFAVTFFPASVSA